MAFTKNNFTDAMEAAETSKKKNPMAFMSWEMLGNDGTSLLRADGQPLLRSDRNSDIPIYGLKGFNKSNAEQLLIDGAKAFQSEDPKKVLELTFRVKIRYYDPEIMANKVNEYEEEIFAAMGLFPAEE